MVKLSLSFLSVAFTIVSAVPYSAQNRFTDHSKDRCLPGTSVKENQPFHLLTSSRLNYVSTFLDGDLLIEGADGNKDLQRLQFCVVLGDEECTATSDYCILEDTEYRVRVHGPEKGYLRAEGYHVRVVEEYEEASDISLVWDTGGVRISTKDRIGDQVLFTATRAGLPIRLDVPESSDRQSFALVESVATGNLVE
ncbi:hypothetical protein BGZ81_002821, partial [Podila clonocystis]